MTHVVDGSITDDQMETKEDSTAKSDTKEFTRKLEYILSLAGNTTGASDFWKFPYLFWTNGGTAFLVPFLLALAVCSLPIYYLEVVVSQYSGRGILNVWEICPLIKGIGYAMFVVQAVTLVYGSCVRVWVLEYIVYSIVYDVPWAKCGNSWNTAACINTSKNSSVTSSANLSGSVNYSMIGSNMTSQSVRPITAEEEFWLNKILAISGSIDDVGSLRWEMVLGSFVFRVIVFLCVIKSIQSIGKIMYVTCSLPLILLLAIWIQTLILPGSVDGIVHFFRPDFTALATPKIWLEAGFTAVFTLSIGVGGNHEIASHGKFSSNCLSSILALVFIDIFGSVFTSLVLFSVLGVMATELGTTVDNVVTGGTSVTFVGFTKAFSFLPFPRAWSIVYFIAVFIAMIDFMIFNLEIVSSFMKQWIPCLRHRHLTTSLLVSCVVFILFLPFCTQAGPYIYHLTDWYIVSWSIQLILLLQIIVFMWIYGGDRINTCIRSMNNTSMPHLLRFAAAYLCPVIYVFFLIISTVHYKPPVYGTYHYPQWAELFGWVLAVLPSVPIILMFVWLLAKQKGSFKQRLYCLLTPGPEWGPKDKSKRRDYLSDFQRKRTVKDIFIFNAIGSWKGRTKDDNGHPKDNIDLHGHQVMIVK